MTQKIIDISTNNDAFQLLQAAKNNRNKRHRQGIFFIEGVKAVNLALQVGWPLEGAVCAAGRTPSGWAADVLARAPRLYRLADRLMDELSDREESSELILLGKIPQPTLQSLPCKSGLLMLLDRPASPGNLGSVIRSADAFGADGLIVCGHSADIYDPQTLRASIGTLLALPVVPLEGPKQLEALRTQRPGIRFVGTSAKGTVPLAQCDLKGPVLLMMGNETDGLSWACKQSCDVLASIPIGGAASSLNLAAAASIALYEAQRQRL